MPTKRNKKLPLSPRLSKISRNKIIVLAAFVLTFVGFGTFFVYRSQAAGYCVNTTLRWGSSGQCVSDAQQMIHNIYHSGSLGHWAGFSDGAIGYSFGTAWHADGQFGGGTYKQVVLFQQRVRLSADGVIGRQTWASLCGQQFGTWVYKNAGCSYQR